MKKLKIGLILAFSMLLTLGLVACGGDKPSITGISFTNGDSVSLVEEKDATKAQTAFNTAVASLDLSITVDGEGAAPAAVKGDSFAWTTSAIDWDVAGTYTATGTPVITDETGYQNPENISVTVTVVVDHNFGEWVNGVSTCTGCGATQTRKDYSNAPIVVNFGAWNAGYTAASTSDPDGFIQPFGTVPTPDGNVTVPTYTVGTLTRGMSIVVEGVGTNSNNTANVYYFPILGIAVRDLSDTEALFPGNVHGNIDTTKTAAGGGAGVLIRNDDWVVLGGINGTLNAFGGTDANSNVAEVPAVADMQYWFPYTTRSSSVANDYFSASWTGDTEFTYTWSFSDEGVVSVICTNHSNGAVLTSYIRIPDGVTSVDTVMHGELFNNKISSLTITEQDLLSDVKASMNSGAKLDYVEGEFLNFSDLNIQTSFESDPDSFSPASGFTLQVYTGSKTTEEEMQADSEKWMTVNDDTSLLSSYVDFRVRVLVGSSVRYSYFKAGDSNFIHKITANSVREAYGHDVTINNVVYKNAMALDDIGYAAGLLDEKVNVVIAPSGVANRVPAGAPAGYAHYISMRIWAEETVWTADSTPAFTVPTGLAENVLVTIGYTSRTETTEEGDKKVETNYRTYYADVVILLNDAAVKDGVTINGMQATPVHFDLSGMQLPDVEVQIGGAYAEGFVPLTGGDLTFTYKFDVANGTSMDDVKEAVSIGIGNRPTALSHRDFDWNEGAFEHGRGILVGDSRIPASGTLSVDGTSVTLTVTYEIPMLTTLPENHAGFFAVLFDYNGITTTDRVYYGAGSGSDATAGYVCVDGMLIRSEGTNLYIAAFEPVADVKDGNVPFDMSINVNAGAATENGLRIGNLDLSYNISDGAASAAATTNRLTSMYTPTIRTIGTANMGLDTDIGYLYIATIDLTQIGYTDAAKNVCYAQVGDMFLCIANGKVTDVTTTVSAAIEGVAAVTVEEGTCIIGAVTGVPYKEGDNVVFYANVEWNENPTHVWGEEKKNESGEGTGVFVCTECGVTYVLNGANYNTGALVGENESLTGLTITAKTSGATSDWGAQIIRTAEGNVIITLPNLDPWNLVQDNMTDAEKALAAKLAGANSFPGAGDLFNGGTWDAFLNKEAFTTVTISPETGISYYLNGILVIRYAPTKVIGTGTIKDFADLVLSLAGRGGIVVAPAGVQAGDVVVYDRALSQDEIFAMVDNNQREDYYPTSHVHNFHADDKTAEDYDRCACGTLNPDHTADSDRHVAGTDNPDTENVNEGEICKICGASMKKAE